MTRLDWRDFGAVGDGTTDCTQAINDCFQTAIDTGMEAYGPAGEYKIMDSLVWNDPFPRISGAGSKTVVRPHARTYDWLIVGPGQSPQAASGPAGWVRDFRLDDGTTTLAPPGTTAGFKLNGARFVEIRNVDVRHAPIGFDLINNNFGSSFYNCRTLSDTCRVGIVLRGAGGTHGFGAGNDISFFNCWFGGREAAVWIEPLSAAYHFFGGQLSLVNPINDDLRGNVVLNTRFDSGIAEMGGSYASFNGVSFEPTQNAWTFRPRAGGFTVHCRDCSFIGDTTGAGGIGVMKVAGTPQHPLGHNDHVSFYDCSMKGVWTSPVPLVLNTNVAGSINPGYYEYGSFTAGPLTIAGTTTDLGDKGMLMLSQQHIRAHAAVGAFWLHAAVRFRRPGATPELQCSFDHGVTWNTIQTVPAP